MLDLLIDDGRVRNAARIARLFRIDPVLVLAEKDQLARAARVAAATIVIDDEERAARRK